MKIERSGKQAITSFESLYQYWQRVFSVALLNKRFYQELANWYFWAMDQVSFPDDVEKNTAIRNATSLIRLITRVIFIWFIKEKQLVPDILFDRREMRRILKTFADTPDAHSYYNAILQNLFFGTLNQKMNERRFAEDTQHYVKADHGVKNLLRYKELFSISAPEVLALFANIPFLNGGLFDCLDKDAVDTGKHVFVDGFTRNAAKRAIVPDLLFFRDETTWDLNALYGTKNKTYTVKGLFDILAAYKFTIAENTPIEEEIALDPELLGKVFENLLASYNPETQTTARKQTGSFYTPREIVNYMVDESLIAYLGNCLNCDSCDGHDSHDLATIPSYQSHHENHINHSSDRLRHLLAYTDAPHQFTDAEVATLITALHAAKILDPACGSGAFPMGMLHKMVHILTKLDPANVRWRETQRRQAIQETEQAFLLGNKEERDKRLLEINDVFEENASDYGRKLYLIENGIYGVDIQPIAIQISKLRVFISLIVDQQVNPAKENLGVRALPNLETKFVAANTLIGLEKPPAQANLFENKAIMALEEQLKDLRHRYFSAKTRKAKMACQHADRALRQQIAQLLVHDNQWTPESARQLVSFDPYDQNAKADFFDPEWMFGLKEGFDIVIGNPPYVQLQKMKTQSSLLAKQGFATYSKLSDVYCLFYEKGLHVLKENGILCYITSNSWMRTQYGELLRTYFAEHTNPLQLLNFENAQIFESAIVESNILLTQKTRFQNQLKAVTVTDDFDKTTLLADYFQQKHITLIALDKNGWIVGDTDTLVLKQKIEHDSVLLKEWNIEINRGLTLGFSDAFIINTKRKEEFLKNSNNRNYIKPLLRGKDVQKFFYKWDDCYLIVIKSGWTNQHRGTTAPQTFIASMLPELYNHLKHIGLTVTGKGKGLFDRDDQGDYWWELRKCAYYDDFEKPKIIWGELSNEPKFAYDEQKHFLNNTVFMITGECLKYLLAILNSRLSKWYFEQISTTSGMGTNRWLKYKIEQMPIKRISPAEQQPFEVLVDHILAAKQQNPAADTRALEAELDRLVYALYGLTEAEITIVEGKNA
ncbi:type IIS restriction enzyme R and M protein [Candidatus Vecturithrix granuli]|uniref:site-specific DNA-methyltransferase (adenine-specific) n=1 Tax=Vecturithrix granuli TaxID=1499967 RepID=A0A081BV77_VECG1|nr:type IIS restriction enzyme R and M protein [Candidatus Vecturithrix granuli]